MISSFKKRRFTEIKRTNCKNQKTLPVSATEGGLAKALQVPGFRLRVQGSGIGD